MGDSTKLDEVSAALHALQWLMKGSGTMVCWVCCAPATTKHEGQLANGDSTHSILALLHNHLLAARVFNVHADWC